MHNPDVSPCPRSSLEWMALTSGFDTAQAYLCCQGPDDMPLQTLAKAVPPGPLVPLETSVSPGHHLALPTWTMHQPTLCASEGPLHKRICMYQGAVTSCNVVNNQGCYGRCCCHQVCGQMHTCICDLCANHKISREIKED